mgnify:CR=1 FL=1
MANWYTKKKELDTLTDDNEKLQIVLNDIYDENDIADDERFPLFIGTIAYENYYKVENIKSAWGKALTNPYQFEQIGRASCRERV